MEGIFAKNKRNEAIELLATQIVQGSRNCVTVIERINSISQFPEKYPDPHEMIIEWHNHLFSNVFHVFPEDIEVPLKISADSLRSLETCFFDYFASLVPFYYEDKTIVSPASLKPKKYVWSKDDYNALKTELFKIRYKEAWHLTRADNYERCEEMNTESLNSLSLMSKSSKIKRSFLNKSKRVEKVFLPNNVINCVLTAQPNYMYWHQSDIFSKYIHEFIELLPSAFSKFDTEFYELGSFLHRYFKWSN